MDASLGELDARLASAVELDYGQVLDLVLGRLDCRLGTLHRLRPGSDLLELVAERNVPDAVRARIQRIPVGKGMAGIAAERRRPVQTCNLQTDASGVVRPGAKETRMRGSIACPCLSGGEVRGVLGVAKAEEYEFSAAEIAWLQRAGELLAKHFARRAADRPDGC